jgi:hypothetical protein
MHSEEWDASGRPRNNLLRHLSERDYVLIGPYIEISGLAANDIIYNTGDDVETVDRHPQPAHLHGHDWTHAHPIAKPRRQTAGPNRFILWRQ